MLNAYQAWTKYLSDLTLPPSAEAQRLFRSAGTRIGGAVSTGGMPAVVLEIQNCYSDAARQRSSTMLHACYIMDEFAFTAQMEVRGSGTDFLNAPKVESRVNQGFAALGLDPTTKAATLSDWSKDWVRQMILNHT